jgi:ParB family transcriptional regulator, chromosome partitioning protein
MAKTPKKQLPPMKFDKELTAGNTKNAMSAAEAKATSGTLYDVPRAQIRVIDGFNVRYETEAYRKHINDLAESIVANGFNKSKPLAGYVAKEGEDHFIYVTDGHSRLRAVDLAVEMGAEIETLPVIVKAAATSMEDLTVALVQENNGRPLQPFEQATVVKRLEGYGWDDDRIAKALTCTTRYVQDLKILAGAPAAVRNYVVEDKVSATEAIKLLRKHDGAKVLELLKAAVAKAEGRGKNKATAKDLGDTTADTGETEEASEDTASVKVTKGKKVTKLTKHFKAGSIYPKSEVQPYGLFDDGSWWNWVDENTKTDVFIEIDTKFEIVLTQPEPADDEDDAPATEQDNQGDEDAASGEDDTFATDDPEPAADEDENGGL